MPNHVHLIATPRRAEALVQAVGATHVRYTRRINLRERWTGYLWQGRFASFAMDEDYLSRCVRYVGLNPVRAGLVEMAERLGAEMSGFFDFDVETEGQMALRQAASTGRPLGATAWAKALIVER
jgi:putative transposase